MQDDDWTRIDDVALGVLAAHDGIAPARAFDAVRLTRRQLAAVFRRGVIERPRTGWYVDPALPWQVKRAIRVGGLATCVTAAALLGLPVPPGAHRRIHVALHRNDSRLRHNRDRRRVVRSGDDPEVRLHWSDRNDPVSRGTAALIDVLLTLACCVPAEWFVAALDAALHVSRERAALLTRAELDRLAILLPPRCRPLLALANPLAESPLETLLRLALDRAGIGWVALQFQAHPRHRVDFLLRARVIVEVDGAAFHDPERDAVRDAELRALGYVVLRFGYDDIVGDMPGVLARIEAVLATR